MDQVLYCLYKDGPGTVCTIHCLQIIQIFELINYYDFGSKLRNQNLIHEEIKSGLNSKNACYHSAHILFCSQFGLYE